MKADYIYSVHPEISAESKMIAFQCMIDAAKQELPLTLEDLKQMEGEPVWVEASGITKYGRYAIVDSVYAVSYTHLKKVT